VKIAIYEPEPRICGPMTCAYHLQAGFQSLGHECDVITFTKSGKPSITWGSMRQHIRWYNRAPDVTARYTDATTILRGYNAVVLSDIRTIMQDKEAVKGQGAISKNKPDYLVALDDARVRFTTAVHGNYYPPKEVQFAAELTSLPAFSGRAVSFAPHAPDASKEIWPKVEWIDTPLPYQMKSTPTDDTPSGGSSKISGITGRFIPNKGHHLLAIAAAKGYIPGNVELWGACSVGAGPSQSYRAFEVLHQEMGLPGIRYGNQPETPNGGDLIRPYPWDITGPEGSIFYCGGYMDPIATCKRLATHVDLTASTFSHGMEFSQFESMDAGCSQVSVESMWNHAFMGNVITAISIVPGEKKLLTTAEGRQLLETVGGAVNNSLTKNESVRRREARHNRNALSVVNDPAAVAAKFLECL
jgi:hypothetical protein